MSQGENGIGGIIILKWGMGIIASLIVIGAAGFMGNTMAQDNKITLNTISIARLTDRLSDLVELVKGIKIEQVEKVNKITELSAKFITLEIKYEVLNSKYMATQEAFARINERLNIISEHIRNDSAKNAPRPSDAPLVPNP